MSARDGEVFDLDEVALMRAAAAGDPAAVRSLIDEVLPTVYGYVLARVGGDVFAAEDVLQETVIEARKAALSFRGDAALSTWLCTIARRRLSRYFDRERKQREMAQRLDEPRTPVEPPRIIDLRDEVLHALGRLSPDHREVLALKYVDEMSTKEIADLLRRSRVQVQSMLQRARGRLREELERARA